VPVALEDAHEVRQGRDGARLDEALRCATDLVVVIGGEVGDAARLEMMGRDGDRDGRRDGDRSERGEGDDELLPGGHSRRTEDRIR